jgi:hypothetical protein
MHRPTIAALAAVLAAPLILGCGSPTPGPRQAPAAPPQRAERAEVLDAVQDLEAAVAEARKAIGTASSSSAAATDAQRTGLSDARRAVVAANVALQKAREALGRDDYAAARQATLGVAGHLRGILGKMRG